MVDAADLKSASRKGVGVRIPSWALSGKTARWRMADIVGSLRAFTVSPCNNRSRAFLEHEPA